MKKQQKKAFTLVELLVVIAILAILASVAVVGYTAFIKNAAVSNDENVVAQMNRYLEALRADSTGEYYNVNVNEDNVWKLTQHILSESGLNELDPQSAKYGYSFWFNFETDQYELEENRVALGESSPLAGLRKVYAADETTYTPKPGNFFTQNHQYFFVNTSGLVAEFINEVYQFSGAVEGEDGEYSAEKLNELYNKALVLTDSVETNAAMANMVKETAFITNGGTMVVNTNDTHTMLVVVDEFDREAIDSRKIGSDGTVVYMDKDNPLIEVDAATTIRIPDNTTIYGDALHVKVKENADVSLEDVIIELGNSSLVENLDANFTSDGIKFVVNGTEYKAKENEEGKTEIFDYNAAEDAEAIVTLESKNPLKEIAVKIEEKIESKKFHTITPADFSNEGYMAWNQTSFTIVVSNAVGANPEIPVSSTAVKWSLITSVDNIEIEQTEGEEVVTVEVPFIQVNETTGKVEILDSDKLLELDSFTIRATSAFDNEVYRDFEIKIVKLQSVEVGLAGEYEPTWTKDGSVTLLYSGGNGTEYSVAVKGATYVNKIDQIELDLNVSVAFSAEHDCLNFDECCLHFQNTHSDSCMICEHVAGQHTDDCCIHEHEDGFRKWCNLCSHPDNCSDTSCPFYNKWTGCVHDSLGCGNKDFACCSHNDGHVYTGDKICCSHLNGTHTNDCYNVCGHVFNNEAHTADCSNCVRVAPVTNGDKITTKGAYTSGDNAQITVTVDHLTWGVTNAIIIDTSNLPVVINPVFKDKNNVFVGNNSNVAFADLFALKDGETIGENYVLKIFSSVNGTTNYMYAAGREDLGTAGEFYVNANEVALYGDGAKTAIDFTGVSGNAPITIAIYDKTVDAEGNATYLRMSEDITINVVEGTNVRNYGELTAKMNDKNVLTDSVVLLGDITMTSDATYFEIPKDMTLYGNLFSMDVTAARNTDYVIKLNNAVLRDVKIVGQIFSTFSLQTGTEYGASIVRTWGASTIENSYIAHGRSPVRIESGTLTVREVVLFGGRYCNLDQVGGTLVIDGKLTTVQQSVTAPDGKSVIGIGISAWFNDSGKTIQFTDNADLVQYNFMSQGVANTLPAISYSGYSLMELKDPFNHIFDNSDYGDYIFTTDTGKYVNAGMAAIDKNLVNISTIGNFNADYKADQEVTISFTATANETGAKIVIGYDKSKFIEVQDKFDENVTVDSVNNDGTITIDSLDLVDGTTYTFVLKFRADTKTSDYAFYFDYAGSALCHLKITDEDGTAIKLENYGDVTYTYDLSTSFAILKGAMKIGVVSEATYETLHNSDLHYSEIEISVNSMLNSNQANIDLLDEYLGLGTTYYPNVYELSYAK